MSSGEPSHRVPLPGTTRWALWRTMAVRGAGFPARAVLRLAAPEAVRLADAVLDAEDAAEGAIGIDALREAQTQLDLARRGLADSFAAAVVAQSRQLAALASEPRFREAVVWQNPGAIPTALDPLLRRGETTRNRSRYRRVEELLASYHQRYCVKNDTIGFMGPVGWGKIEPRHEQVATVDVGPSLLRARGVYFEQWGIDELARTIAADPRLEPWMSPRMLAHVRVEGLEVRAADGRPEPLSPALTLLLTACEGAATAHELAERMRRNHPTDFPSPDAVYEALRRLRTMGLVSWALEVPLRWNPERELARLLDRIDDEALRAWAVEPLARLNGARAAVAQAQGRADELQRAMASLESVFISITSKAPTQNPGGTYGARTLVFEDTQRDMDLTLGAAALEELGPPLALLLDSARWFTFDVARRTRHELRGIFDAVARGSARVRFIDVWLRAQRLFRGTRRPVDEAHRGLRERWGRILGADLVERRVDRRSEDLRTLVEEAFRAPSPGWRAARHHAPDVMIAATDVGALERGDYVFVLGELHPAVCTIDNAFWIAQHPRPRELLDASRADLPEPRVLSVLSKAWPRVTVRTNRALVHPDDRFLETGPDPAGEDPDRVLRIADLDIVDREGTLVVSSPKGDASWEIVEFFGDLLSGMVSATGFRLFDADIPHVPRVTVDRLVLTREAWSFPATAIPLGDESAEADALLSARRWARRTGLPRFVFVRSPLEVKPFFVDFQSPVLIGVLARAVRRAKRHDPGPVVLHVEEMLPDVEHTWLPDAEGERYTSELRLTAVDLQAY